MKNTRLNGSDAGVNCNELQLLSKRESRSIEGNRTFPKAPSCSNASVGSICSASFGYLADPVCIASLLIYVANRWYLKPHHIGGWFTHGYLNDVLCLPLFLPMILRVQRLIGLRSHDDFPTAWEVLQHWAIFSIVFEVIIPRFPSRFDSTADPLDVLAYLAGGTLAWIWWSWRKRIPQPSA